MGALVDQCPECGRFVAKGSAICPHCETELPATVEPADPVPEPAAGGGSSVSVVRVLGGALAGAALAVIALTAGAGDVGSLPEQPSAPRDAAAIVEQTESPTKPQQPQTPATEAESTEQMEPASGLSAERRSRLEATIAAIRAELSTWPERYQIGHSDLSNLRGRLEELEQLIEKIPQRKE